MTYILLVEKKNKHLKTWVQNIVSWRLLVIYLSTLYPRLPFGRKLLFTIATREFQVSVCLYAGINISVYAHVHTTTSAEGRAQVGWSRGWSSAGKEMRILRTLGSYDFKLQPFPDERPDSNPVCSTGVNSYPSASNIQRMAPVFWLDDFFNLPSSH